MRQSTSPGKACDTQTSSILSLNIAPAQVLRGTHAIAQAGEAIAKLGKRPLLVGGDRSLSVAQTTLEPTLKQHHLKLASASYAPDCSEASLGKLRDKVKAHQADCIIGIGGGKAPDGRRRDGLH